jgi:LmbE family N-acetylglucosaminyl deacetylase
MRILVIGSHPDDEILGCGGVINRFKREGHEVKTLIIDGGRNDLKDQKFDTFPIKDFITTIENKINDFRPDMVFTHFIGDLNRDHQIVAEATQVACRPDSCVKELYAYETPGSSALSLAPFKPDTYFIIDNNDLLSKTVIMEKQYSSELRNFPHPRSILGIETLASTRGMEVHSAFAEAFIAIRRKI